DSTFWQRLRHPAYQVQELGNVIFAYLGPEPAPLLPRYDVLVRDDDVRAQRARTVNCNFFQMIENSVDQNHLKWLHRTAKTPTWDDGEINPQPFEYGILNTYMRHVADGRRYAHVNFFVLPTMNKTGNVEEGHPGEHEASSSGEHLAYTDRGVILLRRLYKESIEAVQKGLDSLGVIRDPAKNEIIRLTPREDILD